MSASEHPSRVLIVDDEPSILAVMYEILEMEGFQVTQAESAEQALDIFQHNPFPVVFSDIIMPGMSGIELLRQIKDGHPATQVIMVTSHATLDTAITALRFGANEYVVKPFDDISHIPNLARESMAKLERVRKNEEQIDSLKRQITNLEQANREYRELSIRDGLTGLFNHRYFQAHLSMEVSRSGRHQREFSLIFIDVDHFKNYNDTLGHPEGDTLLKTLSQLIAEKLRVSDILARYGGEEFTIILPETTLENARLVAEKIRLLIAEHPFAGRENQPDGKVTVSIGLASYPAMGKDAETLVKRADEALYQAKNTGRNKVC